MLETDVHLQQLVVSMDAFAIQSTVPKAHKTIYKPCSNFIFAFYDITCAVGQKIEDLFFLDTQAPPDVSMLRSFIRRQVDQTYLPFIQKELSKTLPQIMQGAHRDAAPSLMLV